AEGFGAITTLLGGGRYNGLAEQLGGQDTPGIGFGMGLDRLRMALEAENIELPINDELEMYFISRAEEAKVTAVELVQQLRQAGIQVDPDYPGRKAKAQFKAEKRNQANYVASLGDEELEEGKFFVRAMDTGDEEKVSFEHLVETMKG